jgi:hypothetical protein
VKLVAAGSMERSATRRWTRHGRDMGVELYDAGRYFTVTGRHWPGTPRAVNDATPELVALLRRMLPTVDGQSTGVAIDTIAAGSRDSTLASLGGALRRRGASDLVILTALSAINAEHCDPPMTDSDVRRISQSVARYPVPSLPPGPERYAERSWA